MTLLCIVIPISYSLLVSSLLGGGHDGQTGRRDASKPGEMYTVILTNRPGNSACILHSQIGGIGFGLGVMHAAKRTRDMTEMRRTPDKVETHALLSFLFSYHS